MKIAAPPIQPVARVTLVERVSERILELIASGRWKRGQKLPPEPELCQILGVGRSTLREAVRSLAFLGLLRMRPGEGTFVCEQGPQMLGRFAAAGLLSSADEVEHLCETRIVLEKALAGYCAERAQDAEIEGLRDLARRMDDGASLTSPAFVQLDLEFHLGIAAASGNPVLAQLLGTIRGMLQQWILNSQRVPVSREAARAGHARILAALHRRDAAAASKAMETHLRESYALMLAGLRKSRR